MKGCLSSGNGKGQAVTRMKFKKWKPSTSSRTLTIRSRRLEVRPWTAADYEVWASALATRLPKRNRFDGGPKTAAELTRSSFRKVLRQWQKGRRLKVNFVFGIFDRVTGACLGTLDLYVLNRTLRWANLGCQIHNNHWGKGIASEAAALALKLAFGPLDFHRVEAGCELDNRASARVALRAGMIEEGIRRKFFSHGGGTDIRVLGISEIDFNSKAKTKK